MRTGLALTIHRFAPFPRRMARYTGREVVRPRLAFVAGIFFAAVLAAQAQESVEPDVLPSLAEPPASSAEPTTSTPAEAVPALPQSLPQEALPSSAPSLPSPSS